MKDTQLRIVSSGARGLWIDMLCLAWDSDPRGYLQTATGKPLNTEQITRSTGNCSLEDVARWIAELEDSGVFSRSATGVIYCRRMVRDEHKRRLCQEAGKKGGNPTLKGQAKGQVKGVPTPPVKGVANPNPTPSSSSSSSSSDVLKTPPCDGGLEKKPPAAPGGKTKNGWAIWIDVNRELGRKDPSAFGPETSAAKNIMKALKDDPGKTADVMRAYLRDRDSFLITNGHSLSLLPKRLAKYLNSPLVQAGRLPSNHNLAGKKYEEVIPDELSADPGV